MSQIQWMERLAYAYAKAYQYSDSTVWVNNRAPTTAREKLELSEETDFVPILFGVKDTDQIPGDIVRRLAEKSDFVWLTVDRSTPFGRALDSELINPLTGRLMTGSSSGSVVNILRGIHDLALATDGGGSILAPALASQLYGINAKGFGLVGRYDTTTLDGVPHAVGLGFISHTFQYAKHALEVLLNQTLEAEISGLTVALDSDIPGSVAALLQSYGCIVKWYEKGASFDRERGLALIQRLFGHMRADVIISSEGPIDVVGYSDAMVMNGRASAEGGKYLVRCADLADTTSVAVAGNEIAMGYVVQAPIGFETGCQAIAVAELLVQHIARPAVFEEYFLERVRGAHTGFFHDRM